MPAVEVLHPAHRLCGIQSARPSRFQVVGDRVVEALIRQGELKKAEYSAQRIVEVMRHPARQLAQGAHLFRLDELVLSGPQLFISGAEAAEELTVGYRGAQQVGDEIQQLDLVVRETAGPRAQAVEDTDRLVPGSQRNGKAGTCSA